MPGCAPGLMLCALTMAARKTPLCFVYVLGWRDTKRHLTYVGWTNDIAARLAKHNSGKGARSTRGREWVLLYSEKCASRRHAMSREWHLKRDRGFRKNLAGNLVVPAKAGTR
jgi:putative endonuclease